MGIAEELMRQADHLGNYEGSDPSQASLRRTVSTSYYALFHLLVEAAATPAIRKLRVAVHRPLLH